MQVETHAPAATGARRSVAQPWSAPLLVEGIITTTSLHEALWSELADQSDERLAGLKEDDQRVADVLEGLAPTDAQQAAQVRTTRDDVRDAGSARALRRELNQRASGKSAAPFRSALDHARNGSTRPPAQPNIVNAASTALTGDAAQPTASADSASSAINGMTHPFPTGQRPDGAPPEAAPAKSDPARLAGRPGPPTNAIDSAATTAGAQLAAGSIATSAAIVGPAIQRGEPAPAATLSAPSALAAADPVEAPGSAGQKGSADTSTDEPHVAERESDNSKSAADDRAENVERVLRVLRGSLHRERTTTVIRMDPPELGALRLELDLRKDVLTLRMSAETVAAQDLLRDQLDALRRGLEIAGIRLERVEIQPLPSPHEPPPFAAFGDSGQRRGEPGSDSGNRVPRPASSQRASDAIGDRGIESSLPGAASLGPARLNVVA